jgi:hypothetical protein
VITKAVDIPVGEPLVFAEKLREVAPRNRRVPGKTMDKQNRDWIVVGCAVCNQFRAFHADSPGVFSDAGKYGQTLAGGVLAVKGIEVGCLFDSPVGGR